MSSAYPIPCQSSSVMNGRNGWNSRSVCERTKSITAKVLARRGFSRSALRSGGERVGERWSISFGLRYGLTPLSLQGRGRSFGFGVPGSQHRFARLDIPVAILAPEKAIQRRGGIAEFVFGDRIGNFPNGLVELQQNPFVIRRQELSVDLALHFKRASGILPEVLTSF